MFHSEFASQRTQFATTTYFAVDLAYIHHAEQSDQ